MTMPTFCCRQNPYKVTDQSIMLQFIKKYNVITSPFGHDQWYAQRVQIGEYNEYSTDHVDWVSSGQDRQFIERINNNDIVITPLKGQRIAIVSRVTSKPYRRNFINVYIVWEVTDDSDKPKYIGIYFDISRFRDSRFIITVFCPVVRDIEICGIYRIPKMINDKKIDIRSLFDQKSLTIARPCAIKLVNHLIN